MQNKLFLKAADICELLEVKQTSAYEIIGKDVYKRQALYPLSREALQGLKEYEKKKRGKR